MPRVSTAKGGGDGAKRNVVKKRGRTVSKERMEAQLEMVRIKLREVQRIRSGRVHDPDIEAILSFEEFVLDTLDLILSSL